MSLELVAGRVEQPKCMLHSFCWNWGTSTKHLFSPLFRRRQKWFSIAQPHKAGSRVPGFFLSIWKPNRILHKKSIHTLPYNHLPTHTGHGRKRTRPMKHLECLILGLIFEGSLQDNTVAHSTLLQSEPQLGLCEGWLTITTQYRVLL